MKQYLVLDMGGSSIKYALMTEDGTFLDKGKCETELNDLDRLLELIGALGDQYAGRYAGVAVSMPGRIDTANGMAYTGGAYLCIADAPMRSYLQECLQAPVTIANDAKCAAGAEAWSGALADVADGVVLVLGSGIGGGVVLNHQVRMGHTFGSGELSFLSADFRKTRPAGDSGSQFLQFSWTTYSSTTGLLREYALRKGMDPLMHGQNGQDFFAAWDQGEEEARGALQEFAANTAAGIYAIQSVLDVERFAIGGGISARPEVTESIRKAVDELWAAYPFLAFGKPEIVSCRYGNDANLIGALAFHLKDTCAPGKNKAEAINK